MWTKKDPDTKAPFRPVPANRDLVAKTAGPALKISAGSDWNKLNPQGHPQLGFRISWEFMEVNGFSPILCGKS